MSEQPATIQFSRVFVPQPGLADIVIPAAVLQAVAQQISERQDRAFEDILTGTIEAGYRDVTLPGLPAPQTEANQ